MNGNEFLLLLLSEFPALTPEVHKSDGLLHVQMHVFTRHTQVAIDSGDMQALDRCFALAHRGFRDADSDLKNAFYVSYLEHLDFTGPHGAASKLRMTPLLHAGFTEIMDYLEQLSRSAKKRDSHKISAGSVWCLALLGLVAGFVISGLAAFFTGAGHGWSSGAISSLSIAGAPLAVTAWAFRGRPCGRTLSVIALWVGIVTDAWLWTATASEGMSYLGKVWDAAPLLLLLWSILFIGWQFIAVSAALFPISERSQLK
jgi:hypothetical protein